MESLQSPDPEPTIKEQLMKRFITAKKQIVMRGGRNWREQLSAADPYFGTESGSDDLNMISQAINDRRRGQVDRVKRVVLAMEKLAEIPHATIL